MKFKNICFQIRYYTCLCIHIFIPCSIKKKNQETIWQFSPYWSCIIFFKYVILNRSFFFPFNRRPSWKGLFSTTRSLNSISRTNIQISRRNSIDGHQIIRDIDSSLVIIIPAFSEKVYGNLKHSRIMETR